MSNNAISNFQSWFWQYQGLPAASYSAIVSHIFGELHVWINNSEHSVIISNSISILICYLGLLLVLLAHLVSCHDPPTSSSLHAIPFLGFLSLNFAFCSTVLNSSFALHLFPVVLHFMSCVISYWQPSSDSSFGNAWQVFHHFLTGLCPK